MDRWDDSLDSILARVWAELARGVKEDSAPARRPVLATIAPDGGPAARIVVLRRADSDAGELDLYTDRLSDKVPELTANPGAALHVWDPDLALQIRLRGQVRIATGPTVTDIWNTLPDHGRGNYGVVPPPSTRIDAPDAYTRVGSFDRLAVLTLTAEAIDAVVLARDFHRRAFFRRAEGWHGSWRAP